jgi:hypothetical protein
MNNSQTNMKENQNVTLTDNGMVTNPTSLIECVDLFFSIGLMRGKTSSWLPQVKRVLGLASTSKKGE